ncbi:hypothetical protein, no similarity [Geotrichum candidum]|uniref:Uncharacterized protein n=1 Tax=Geotrichum candidum TaxID=1173061 RepID=A0A0J9XI33_GEOCN|nr:hypothetical protein, no similarity [Geotrichum candidum]
MIRSQANYTAVRLKYTTRNVLRSTHSRSNSTNASAATKKTGSCDDTYITAMFRSVVQSMGSAPQTLASEAQLDAFIKSLQETPYSGSLTPVLYTQIMRQLLSANDLAGAEHCNSVLTRRGIVPRPNDWPELLTLTHAEKTKQSALLLKIFQSGYPVNQSVKKMSAAEILAWLESSPATLNKTVADTWFYNMLLLACPESTPKNAHIIKNLFRKKLNSAALDQKDLYRTFLRSLAKGTFHKTVNRAYIQSFLGQISRMQLSRRETTARRFIYAIMRFDPAHRKKLLTMSFWVTLVRSQSGLDNEEIEKLVNSIGFRDPTPIYEAIILNTKDFQKCNRLYEKYFAPKMNASDHSVITPEKQMSLNVYSYIIKLLCNYSPKDAHEIARNPSVYEFEQLARGYFVGLLQARDYPRAIEYYQFLESKNRVTNNIWNLYVFALTKVGNVKLAVKLATEALHSSAKCKYSPPGTSFLTELLDSYNSRNVTSASPQTQPPASATDAPQAEVASTSNKADPFANFKPVVQPAKKPTRTEHPTPQWSYSPDDLQPSAYKLSIKTFRKVAQAMIYYQRTPLTRMPKKRYEYGQVRPVDRYRTDMVLYEPSNCITDGTDIDYAQSSASHRAERFPIKQITEFLKLGWYVNSENGASRNHPLTAAGMQLPPTTIMRLLLDIQFAKLWFQRKELITLIYTLAEVYPRRDKLSETITLHDNGTVYYQHDLFTTKLLSTLIALGYVKSPMAPWVTLALLSDLVDRYSLVVRPDQIQACLQDVMVQVHRNPHVPGELRRARWQARGFDSLQTLFDTFNSAWLGDKADDFREIIRKP